MENKNVITAGLQHLTALQFNDMIIDQPDFSCFVCAGFLWPPIKITKSGANICGKCCTDSSDDFIPNKTLETILEYFRYSCIFSENGCQERQQYVDMAVHVSQCSYRSFSCPMNTVTECNWEGYNKDFVDHFKKTHSQYIFPNDTDSICFQIDLNKNTNVVKLLSIPTGNFLLTTNSNIDQNIFSLMVYFIQNTKLNESYYNNNYEVVVEYGNITNGFVKQLDKIEIPNINTYSIGQVKNIETNIDMIQKICNNEQYQCNIKIFAKDLEEARNDLTLLKFFECPICNNYMRPPIYQCISGHSICNLCRAKINQCPTCRSEFSNTRNYSLEDFSSQIYFPCAFRDGGCTKSFKSNEIVKHEADCFFKQINCPFSSFNAITCNWFANIRELSSHLKDKHTTMIFTDYNRFKVPFNMHSEFCDIVCFIAYGKIFRVSHKRDRCNQNCYWSVQLIGPKSECKNYICEVGLISECNPNRKLKRVDICQEFTNFDSAFNQSIMIPTNVVSGFSKNSLLTYEVLVQKL